MKRVLPLLAIVTVLALIAAPRERPNPAPSGTSGVAGSTSLGAPFSVVRLRYLPRLGSDPASEQTGGLHVIPATPRPSGGLGDATTSYFKPTPEPRVVVSKGSVTGDATYYCRPGISRCTHGHPFGMYAAAGPEVRAMLGPDWREQFVIVTDETGRGVVVQLIDWCACSGSHVIDLYWTAYEGMVNPVTVKEEP